ncbi:MAG: hypothetical protein LRY62_02095 [Alphaproteobacteria bacterium]|nr:hypothetical protein [Alphaproteobacteria bacterium]
MTDTTDMNRFIDDLMSKMTLKEKIGQLNHPPSEGMDTTGIAKAVDMPVRIRRGEVGSTVEPNLEARIKMQEIAVNEGPNKIPLMFGVDVIHGHKTLLPIPLGLSCSWDTDLIERTAVMAAREARAEGISLNWSPMVDVCYDARWGRISEGNGEFPYLGARIAEAWCAAIKGRITIWRGPTA